MLIIIKNIVETTENAMDVLKTLLTSAGDCLVHRLRKNWSDERVID
jgi:hypothetical protein